MRMKHVRDFSLRYDILRGKIKYAEAEAVGAAAVSMDARRKIKQVFTGDLILPEQMERLTDRLRPVLILDGTEYPLGQFILTTAKQEKADAVFAAAKDMTFAFWRREPGWRKDCSSNLENGTPTGFRPCCSNAASYRLLWRIRMRLFPPTGRIGRSARRFWMSSTAC